MYVTTKNNSMFPYYFFRDFLNEDRTLPMRSDMYLDGDNYRIDVELPGVKKENIDINYEDEYLTVQVKAENADEKKDTEYLVRERCYASTSRSFHVGEIDEKTIDASFQDGVLTIKFPKEQPKTEVSHRIAIQ